MRSISHRELRNHSGEVLAAVRGGETISVTNHGEVTAVLVPPSSTPYERLVASGLVIDATSTEPFGFDEPIVVVQSTSALLDDLREER